MHRKWMKAIAILAVLLISMVSLSMAACPRAYPESYQAPCGAVFNVPAPGILSNDVKDADKTLSVVLGSIRFTSNLPQYGTIAVDEDGSFKYTAAPNIPTGTRLGFYYKVTDGSCISGETYTVISIDCKCTAKAPRIEICEPTLITADWLYSKGAGCFGCSGVTTSGIDLSQIPLPEDQVPGECYPYTVTCPGCQVLTGYVCLVAPCDFSCVDFTVCPGVVPDAAMILDKGQVRCSCDPTPAIVNIRKISDVCWTYDIVCDSVCGPITRQGCLVCEEPPCEISCVPFVVCPDHEPDADEIREKGEVTCLCDPSQIPVISNIRLENGRWEYDVTCTSPNGCDTTVAGCGVDIEPPCVIEAIGFDWCPEPFVAPTPAQILDEAQVTCSCDATPEITNIHVITPGNENENALWGYDITCTSENGCITTLPGEFTACIPLCPSGAFAPDFCVCPGTVLTKQMFLDKEAGCTLDPCPTCGVEIDFSGVDTSKDGVYEYTVTCTNEGCPDKTATGTVSVPGDCDCGCPCTPEAPYICGCLDHPMDYDDFIAAGVKCVGDNCGAPDIDFSEVKWDTLGLYSYYVTCGGEDCDPVEGHVCVDVLCGPASGTYAQNVNLIAGQNYDAGDVTVSLDNQGYLVVELEAAQGTDDCGDWTFTDDGAVYIGLDPITNCAPGQFPYKTPVESTSTYKKYRVLLSSIAPTYCMDDSPTIYVDVHASMTSECLGQTAWAAGNCAGGCGQAGTPLGEICFEIPCNCVCPTECHC